MTIKINDGKQSIQEQIAELNLRIMRYTERLKLFRSGNTHEVYLQLIQHLKDKRNRLISELHDNTLPELNNESSH